MTSAANTAFVGSIPELYDRHLGPVFFDPAAADLVPRVDPAALPLLELASGTGRLSAPLLDRLQGRPFVAVDLNHAMQTIAHRLVSRRVRHVTGDATRLPFADETFAQAICQFGVMFFPDKVRAAAEIHRVLEPGASFLFNVWASLAENPVGAVANQAIAGLFPDDPPLFIARNVYGYTDPAKIRIDTLDGGFSRVDIATVELEGTSESAMHTAIGLVQGTPMSIAVVERGGPDAIPRATEAVANALAKAFGPGTFTAPMRQIVVQAWA